MVEDLIEKTYEIFSEFAKHLLKISNKNNLLHLSLTNINTGLYFQDVFNLEKLNQILIILIPLKYHFLPLTKENQKFILIIFFQFINFLK